MVTQSMQNHRLTLISYIGTMANEPASMSRHADMWSLGDLRANLATRRAGVPDGLRRLWPTIGDLDHSASHTLTFGVNLHTVDDADNHIPSARHKDVIEDAHLFSALAARMLELSPVAADVFATEALADLADGQADASQLAHAHGAQATAPMPPRPLC